MKLLFVLVFIAAGLVACSGGKTANTAVTADVTRAKTIVDGCVAHSGIGNHSADHQSWTGQDGQLYRPSRPFRCPPVLCVIPGAQLPLSHQGGAGRRLSGHRHLSGRKPMTATTAAAPVAPAKRTKLVLPPPLVHLFRHPYRWTKNKIKLLIAALTLAHIGMLIVVAIYYLGTQKIPAAKNFWDNTLVPNSNLRHSIRDVAEGVVGGFLAQAIVWNHYTRSHLKAGRTLDKIRDRYHVPVLPTALVSAFIFGAVGFALAYYGLHAWHVHAHVYATTGSQVNRTENIWKSSWDKKAIGYAAALVARRPLHDVFDDIQVYFAERRVAHHKPLRWYHPPTFAARVNAISADDTYPLAVHGRVVDFAMVGALVLGVGLAGYGYYILTRLA